MDWIVFAFLVPRAVKKKCNNMSQMSYICPFLAPLPPLASSCKLARNEHTASFKLKILPIKRERRSVGVFGCFA